MKRFKEYFSKLYQIGLIFFATILLAGCATSAPAPTNILNPCESPTTLVYTGSSLPELQSPQAKEIADKIYSKASENLPVAKREALRFLAFETVRWSDVQHIGFEAQPRMRLVVSFVTPGLVRAIVLNHLLSRYGSGEIANLEQKTNDSLDKLEKKRELAFFLLIQTEESITPIKYSIRPDEIMLHNTAGLQVASKHSDDFLNSDLVTSEKRQAGFFSFPASVTTNGTCGPFLITNTDTSLVLKVDTAKISEHTNVMLNWRIYFPVLADLNSPLFKLNLDNNNLDGTDGLESPLQEPPGVDYNNNSLNNDAWRDIGRFIWWNLTRDYVQN